MTIGRATLRGFLLLTCLLILLGAGGLLFAVAREAKAANESLPSVDSEKLHEAIALAANYFVRACKPDGQFVYRINLNPEFTPAQRYNILRHAGAIYALAMYHQWRPDDRARETMVRAARFLRDRCVGPLPNRDNLLAVWSPPGITHSGKPLQAKLGGAGLGLVALLSLEKVKPNSTSLADLRQLGRFVLYMQKADGSFYSKYVPSEGGRQETWKSLYYPGEAALGLLMLYERDPSSEWLNASARALGYLARSREGSDEVPADHWALLATAKLLPLYSDHNIIVPRQAVLRHAIQISESILRSRPAHSDDPILFGSFTMDGRTTPTATRLEGLLAALEYLPPEQQQLRARAISAVHDGINFLLRAQVHSGDFAGGMPRAIRQLPHVKLAAIEQFNRRATEVRIDYVQHAMSAMIQYAAMFAPER